MRLNTTAKLAATGAACALAAGCGSTPPASPEATQAFITGSAQFHERIALPPNAVFEALLEDVSRADARALVIGQQNLSPAGNPPYALNIPYNPSRLVPGGRYVVRTMVRVNDRLWFTNDQAVPVLQHPGDTRVQVTMRRVADHQQAPAPQPMPKPGSTPHAGQAGAVVPATLQQHNWQVTQLQGRAPTAGMKAPTLRFEASEARVAGNTSCNNYSATYTLQGQQIQFMTKMACARSQEPAFLEAMNQVRSLHSSGRTLHLKDRNGRTLITATRL